MTIKELESKEMFVKIQVMCLIGAISFVIAIDACTPPMPPVGIEYCEAAASRIVFLACTTASSARVANACRAALSDPVPRDWHPRAISSASTCASVSALIEGRE